MRFLRRPRVHLGGEGPLLDQADLKAATIEVAYKARQDQVTVALVGGYALQQYGSTRLTSDLDVAATQEITTLVAQRALSFGGYASTTDSGVPIDVIVRNDKYADLYNATIAAARPLPGVALPVAPLEYLAAMKIVAGRSRDDADLEWILLSGKTDPNLLHDVVAEFLGRYAADELDALAEEITWQASRGR